MKNKILLLMVMCFFCISGSCFAFTLDGMSIAIEDIDNGNEPFFAVFKRADFNPNDTITDYYVFRSPCTLYVDTIGGTDICSPRVMHRTDLRIENGKFVYNGGDYFMSGVTYTIDKSFMSFYTSNHDITDPSGKVIFQVPSPLTLAVQEAVAEKILTPEAILKQIIYWTPLVIGLIICCLAFRKALKILLSIVRNA